MIQLQYMRIFNKKAKFEFSLEPERFEAGIVLTGGEAKAVRGGHCDLSSSFAKVLNNEVYLINTNIPIEGAKEYNSTRSRKLLLHKNQIVQISTKIKQRKLTIVPISMYNKRNLVKVELAMGKSKRKFEKKEVIKKRDIEREIARMGM